MRIGRSRITEVPAFCIVIECKSDLDVKKIIDVAMQGRCAFIDNSNVDGLDDQFVVLFLPESDERLYSRDDLINKIRSSS
jgi:hypothetical protein